MSRFDDTHAAPPAETLDLRAYARPVWRWKWVIGLIVVIAAAGTYFISSRRAKQYVASTQVYVAVADPTALAGAAALLEPVAAFATDEVADAGPELFGDTFWLSDDASRAAAPGAAQPDPQSIAPTTSNIAVGATACTSGPRRVSRRRAPALSTNHRQSSTDK